MAFLGPLNFVLTMAFRATDPNTAIKYPAGMKQKMMDGIE